MPGAHFEAFASEHGVTRDLDPSAWGAALHAGNAVLVGEPVVPTVADEADLFAQYFTVVALSLGLPSDDATLRRLADETVFGTGHEALYDGVPATLERLSGQGCKLFLLANGWPSLSRRYVELGLRDFFDVFVTSTQLGIKKPNPRVFRLMSEITNVDPANLLVVDDLAANVLTAAQLGMPGVLVSHGATLSTPGLDHIDNVAALPLWMEAADAAVT
jgi:putative hydrolase of the HAD superfamily